MRSLLQKKLFKKAAGLLMGAVLYLTATVALATDYRSLASGNWNLVTNWEYLNPGGQWKNAQNIPVGGDNITILTGHQIDIPSGYSASCASLINNGTFNLNSETLNITGSLAGTGSFIFGTNSTMRFNGTALQTIPALSYANIWVENTAGVQLTDNLSISGNLTLFDNSKLFNNGKTVSSSGSGKTLLLNANSEIVLQGNTTLANLLAGLTPSLAITSTITYDASNTAVNISGGTYGKLVVNSAKALAGDITLGGAATINAAVSLNGNSIIAGSNDITITATGSIMGESQSSYVKLGTGKLIIDNIGTSGKSGAITFPVGTTSYTPAIITNSGSSASFSVGLVEGVANNGTQLTTNVVKKTWNITPTGTFSNVTLRFQWNSGDEATNADPNKAFNRLTCAIVHANTAGKWDNKAPAAYGVATSVATGTNATGAPGETGPFYITRTGVNTFSPFTVDDANSPLPVELTYFTAIKKNAEVALTWETASEKNNTGFEVQSSTDGRNYEAVGFVATQNGNASSVQRYAFTHKTGSKEGLVYYRLKQIDLDGSFEYYTAVFDAS